MIYWEHISTGVTNSTFRGDMPPLSYNAFEWLALEIMKNYDIGWEWHVSLPVNSKFTKLDKMWNLYWNAINIWYLSHSW